MGGSGVPVRRAGQTLQEERDALQGQVDALQKRVVEEREGRLRELAESHAWGVAAMGLEQRMATTVEAHEVECDELQAQLDGQQPRHTARAGLFAAGLHTGYCC